MEYNAISMACSRPTTVIPDVHGDNWALRCSLTEAGCIKGPRGGLTVISGDDIVLTGDLLDRYTQNRAVLDTIQALQAQARTTVLMGNHDAFMLQATLHAVPGDIMQWFTNGGYSVLREVARAEHMVLQKGPSPFPVPLPQGIGGSFMRAEWESELVKRRMENYDLPTAFARWQELLRTDYRQLFTGMKLVHPLAQGHALAVHAGVPMSRAEQEPRTINRRLARKHAKGDYTSLQSRRASDDGRMLWMRAHHHSDGKVLSGGAAWELLQRDVSLVVHGHDVLRTGIQTLTDCHGVHTINGDVGMSRWYPTPSNWGYVHFDKDDKIEANSEAGGTQDFGHFENGKYVPPATI